MPQAAKQLQLSSIQIFDWGKKMWNILQWLFEVTECKSRMMTSPIIPRILNILLYMVRGTLQMWLRYRDGKIILVYPVGPKSSQRSLQEKSRRIRVKERQREIWRCYDAGLKDEGRGHKPIWEKPGMDSPLEIPEEIQSCQQLDFSPVRFM